MRAAIHILTVFAASLVGCAICWAQPLPLPQVETPPGGTAPLNDDFGGPLVSDSGVGYIDNAMLGDQFWFRFDASYDNNEPARAEFFWPVNGPFGPGPGPETRVDYQDFSFYAERQIHPAWSVFGELPLRLMNPEIQDNVQGVSDINVGFKHLLHVTCDTVKTFQFRTYIPTADETLGLGTGHVTIEPAYLFYHRHSERWSFQGEVRDWISLGGSDGFAGNVMRYGLGANYRLNPCSCQPISGVFEAVGWTVLNGGTAITTPPTTQFTDATGDTIVNAKFGLRLGVNETDSFYLGYGHALTEQHWYQDVLRIEFRRAF